MDSFTRDLLEIVDAANAYRRSRGQRPMSFEEIRRRVGRDQLTRLETVAAELLVLR